MLISVKINTMIISQFGETLKDVTEKQQGFKCNRCDHIWVSKYFDHTNIPPSCAKCKSPRWNK